MEFRKVSQLSKGWSSNIFLARDENGKKVVIKEVREKSPRKNLAEREGKMLLLANKVRVGPKVFEVNYEKNFVAREYIEGERLNDWILGKEFSKVTREQYYSLIKELYRQLLRLDTILLSHNQLGIGKNILVSKKTSRKTGEVSYLPTIIDFEKASVKQNHTKNIGQLESMLFYNPHSELSKKSREKLGATL